MKTPRVPKDLRKLIQQALDHGWTLEQRTRHVGVRSPEGRLVIVGGSPSDHRNFQNTKRDLRHAGLPV